MVVIINTTIILMITIMSRPRLASSSTALLRPAVQLWPDPPSHRQPQIAMRGVSVGSGAKSKKVVHQWWTV